MVFTTKRHRNIKREPEYQWINRYFKSLEQTKMKDGFRVVVGVEVMVDWGYSRGEQK
jgi:hypothetical protein